MVCGEHGDSFVKHYSDNVKVWFYNIVIITFPLYTTLKLFLCNATRYTEPLTFMQFKFVIPNLYNLTGIPTDL
jgi:hypothetical protein